MDIQPGDIVRLRKKHPCGSDEWQVTRTGADIRIKCLGCQRYILMDRFTLEHRIKSVISRGNQASEDKHAQTPE